MLRSLKDAREVKPNYRKKVEADTFVKFTRNVDAYSAGEVARFTLAQAKSFIKRKVAKMYTPEKKKQMKSVESKQIKPADDDGKSKSKKNRLKEKVVTK